MIEVCYLCLLPHTEEEEKKECEFSNKDLDNKHFWVPGPVSEFFDLEIDD